MKSRPQLSWLLMSGIAAVLASILVFLFIRTQGSDTSSYYENVALLRQLKQLDARWELDVLKSRMGFTANYDSLVDPLTALNELWQRLHTSLDAQPGAARGDLLQASAAYHQAVDEKTRLIEHFKSHNSVLRNSFVFLPIAAEDIRNAVADNHLDRLAPNTHLSASVAKTLLDTLIYCDSPSDDKRSDVEDDLKGLSTATFALPPDIADAPAIFVAHVRTVLREQPAVNSLLSGIAAVRATERLDKLDALLSSAHRAAEAQALVYRRYLLILSTALALLLIYVGVRLIRSHAVINRVNRDLYSANETLEQRVAERTAELHDAQSKLLASARGAGMAEIATNVLHNVGNVLNSVNISTELIGTRLRESKFKGLVDAVHLVDAHPADLADFLTHDEKGKRLPAYLGRLVPTLQAERNAIASELESLVKGVAHIRDIVATQQSYAGSTSIVEPLEVNDLLEDALRMNAGGMARRQVAIVKDWTHVPPVLLDKHLMLQILVNLIANALQAMDSVMDRPHRLILRASVGSESQAKLRIEVQDNGEGILPENLPRIFEHGFTTRRKGHGFGLHSCALAAKAMGGQLTVHSDGAGAGATFTLDLPLKEVPRKAAVTA
jgi:two-component system, NtrC family, sensor kinase